MIGSKYMAFTPTDWFWVVGGDESRAWSSAAGAYVTDYPADRLTRIDSEASLTDVLRRYGLRGPAPTPIDVKTEAQRRIYERHPQWKQANMTVRSVTLVRLGEANWSPAEAAEAAELESAWTWIREVRTASNAIEVLSPIPIDFAASPLWPA